MKKIYMTPEMETIEIQTSGALLMPMSVNGKTNNSGDLLAPGYDFDDDFDEE